MLKIFFGLFMKGRLRKWKILLFLEGVFNLLGMVFKRLVVFWCMFVEDCKVGFYSLVLDVIDGYSE